MSNGKAVHPSNQTIARPRKNRATRPVSKAQVLQMLKGFIETKYGLFTTGVVNVATTGTLTKLTVIAQAVGQSARIGDQVRLKSMQVRYSITVGAPGLLAAADQFNTVRLIVFKWKIDDSVTVPTASDILNTTTTTNLAIAPHSWDTKEKYDILYDSAHVVFNSPIWNGAAVTWQHGVGGTYATPREIQLRNLGLIDFTAATTSGVGQIYSLLLSDSAFAPNPTCELAGIFEFYDA